MRGAPVFFAAMACVGACSLVDFGGFTGGALGVEGQDADIDGSTSSGEGGASSGADGSPIVESGTSDDAPGGAYRAAVMADGPIAYWRLGEASGLTAKDEVGAHPGGYQGGFTLGAPGVVDDTDTALTLAGTNGSVQIGDVLDFVGNVAISLEAWVQIDVLDTDYKRVIAKRGAEGGYSIFCQKNSNGCSLELSGTSGGVTCDMTMELGQWYHLVGTYDGATARAFRDGVEVCSKIATLTFTKVSGNLVIGAWPQGGNYFTGKLDEIAIYDKALPAARVNEHYAHRKP